MAESLYPTFDLPEEYIDEEDENIESDLSTVFFDFETKEVPVDENGRVIMLTGHEAYRQWVIKCVLTERFKYLAYDTDQGIEAEAIIAADYDRDVAIMEIRRSVIEAIMVDDRTISVTNVDITWTGDNYYFDFEVESVFGTDVFSVAGGASSG